MSVRPRPSLEAGHVAEKAYLGPTYALLYLRLGHVSDPKRRTIVVERVSCDAASSTNCRQLWVHSSDLPLTSSPRLIFTSCVLLVISALG